MSSHARGAFDAQMKPQGPDESAKDPALARLSLDKQFDGELVATSKGQMLASGTHCYALEYSLDESH